MGNLRVNALLRSSCTGQLGHHGHTVTWAAQRDVRGTAQREQNPRFVPGALSQSHNGSSSRLHKTPTNQHFSTLELKYLFSKFQNFICIYTRGTCFRQRVGLSVLIAENHGLAISGWLLPIALREIPLSEAFCGVFPVLKELSKGCGAMLLCPVPYESS